MILVTGASGEIGGRVARALSRAGIKQRLLSRDPVKLPSIDGAEVVQGDYSDMHSLLSACRGVSVALVVSGYAKPMERALLHKNVFQAAAKCGVGFMVYTSFQNASPDSRFPMGRDHFATECHLKACGVAHAILRDNLYMDLAPEMFGRDGVARGPAGQGRIAWVSRDDVARVASHLLLNPTSASVTHTITGPEALTFQETAAVLSKLSGRSLSYETESVEEGRAWRSKLGAPEWEVDTWLGSYEAVAAGELEQTSDAVEQITGTKPIAFADYFQANPQLLKSLAL